MMIWKNDTGLPFTEIRRACCAAGGKTSESRKTWRIKERMETVTMLDAGETALAWWPAESPSLRTLRGGAPVASQRPLGSSALKKGKLQAECWDAHTDQSKRRGTRDRETVFPKLQRWPYPSAFVSSLFFPSSVVFLLRQDPGYLAGLESVVPLLSVVPKC